MDIDDLPLTYNQGEFEMVLLFAGTRHRLNEVTVARKHECDGLEYTEQAIEETRDGMQYAKLEMWKGDQDGRWARLKAKGLKR